jgi:Protein of unknown function (DUF2591)
MKYKTNKLTGALLDAAVAKARGMTWRIVTDEDATGELLPPGGVCVTWHRPEIWQNGRRWSPSTDWGHGGPILHRERIAVAPFGEQWGAIRWENPGRGPRYIDLYDDTLDGAGETPLIAAMRAYVASKFGEEVEL